MNKTIPDLTLAEYLARCPRGTALRLAATMQMSSVQLTQWANQAKPRAVPDSRAQHLEWATNFVVRCERSVPGRRWVRIPDSSWPHGRPLLDYMPEFPGRQIPLEDLEPAPAAPQAA